MALLAGSHPAAATAHERPAATHCKPGEKTLYSCRFRSSIGSVCGAPGAVHYRYGPAGRPAIDIANDARWSNIREGGVVGGGRGHQTHLRFSNRAYHYVVFWGYAGSLTERPGTYWSGIAITRKDGFEKVLTCPGRAMVASDPIGDLYRFAPDSLRGELEDKDSDFDAWY